MANMGDALSHHSYAATPRYLTYLDRECTRVLSCNFGGEKF